MSIKNIKQSLLFMDFSKIKCPQGAFSDIDGIYLGKYYTLILEIKNEHGTFSENQQKLYESLAQRFNSNVFIAYVTHNKRIENGDTEVDISKAKLQKYFFQGLWYESNATEYVSVQQFLDFLEKRFE